MSDTGMATSGTSTVRNEPRNRKMTMMTMSTVSASVCSTSLMASWMYVGGVEGDRRLHARRQLAADGVDLARARAR